MTDTKNIDKIEQTELLKKIAKLTIEQKNEIKQMLKKMSDSSKPI